MITISQNTVYSVLEGRVKASLAADIPKKIQSTTIKEDKNEKKILADDDYAYLYLSLSRLVNKDSSLRAMHTIIPSTRRNSRPSHVVQAK